MTENAGNDKDVAFNHDYIISNICMCLMGE